MHLNLKTKLLIALIGLLVVVLCSIFYSLKGAALIKEESKTIMNVTFPALDHANKLLSLVKNTKSVILDAFESMDSDILEEVDDNLDVFRNTVQKIGKNDSELNVILNNYVNYCRYGKKIINNYVESEDDQHMSQEILKIGPLTIKLSQQIETYRKDKLTVFTSGLNGIYEISDNFTKIFWSISLILVIVVMATITLSIIIISGINELVKSSIKLRDGDFESSIKVTRNDELGTLQQTFEKMRLSLRDIINNLDNMVEERTQQLEKAQEELVVTAHKSGMAEVATGTLHNIGNILNSVRASSSILSETYRTSLFSKGFAQATQLLKENVNDLKGFIGNNPKGEKLLHYYLALFEEFEVENEKNIVGVKRIEIKVNTIADVIATQQQYAGSGHMMAKHTLVDIVEDCLTMTSPTLNKYNVEIIKNFERATPVLIEKLKVVQIIVNLIENAKDAVYLNSTSNRKLWINLSEKDRYVELFFKDNGEGISDENLIKIFQHGFTTKETGHGFGLHSCGNYMNEMKGKIKVDSEGVGKGSTFTLLFRKPD